MSELAKKKVRKKPSGTQVAIEAGYSENYAKTGRFKKTEIWDELMEIHLPNSKLARVHGELLGSAEIQHYIFPKLKKKKALSRDEIKAIVESVPGCRLIYIKPDVYTGQIAFFQSPDSKSRREALDMAYKMKGNYAAEKIELTRRKYQDLSNAELAALEKKLIDKIKKRK